MLSPWLQPSAINSPLQAAGSLGIGGYDSSSSLDKRDFMEGTGKDAKLKTNMSTRDTVNDWKTVAETVTNALGNRSPYYIIGEIPDDNFATKYSKYLGEFGGAVRAVVDFWTGKEQEGVIIDCLGDVSGTIGIEVTANPILYKASTVADGRMRKPTVVKAVVGVSNYNNDDLIDMGIDTLSAIDPTGLLGKAANMLVNGGETRAQAALYKLRWLQENGKPFKVYTPHGLYENMVIQTIEPVTNAGTMDMLFANITFIEIIYAQPYFSNPGDASTTPIRDNVVETNPYGLEEGLKDSYSWASKKIGGLFGE